MENSGSGSFLRNRRLESFIHTNSNPDVKRTPKVSGKEAEERLKTDVYVDDDGWVCTVISCLRIVVCFLTMMVTTFIWALIMVVLLPWPSQRIRQGNVYGHVTGRLLMWILGNPVKIEGSEFSNTRAIYISNHASPIDIFLIMWLTPTGTVGIAKKEVCITTCADWISFSSDALFKIFIPVDFFYGCKLYKASSCSCPNLHILPSIEGEVEHLDCLDIPSVRTAGQIIWYPLFGQLYVLANHLRIDRSNPAAAIQSMNEAVDAVIRNKLSLIIFPEGTRSKNGRLLPFKKGFVHLALQSRLPIVPMVLTGTHLAWRKGSLHVRPAPITVKYLPPIITDDWKADKIDDHIKMVHDLYVENLPASQKPIVSQGTQNGSRS